MSDAAGAQPRAGKVFERVRNTLSLIRSLTITDPLIYFYTAVMGTFSLLGSVLDASGRWQHGCARIWSRLILKTSRIAVQVEGLENIRPGEAAIFCVNHPSAMDIPILFVHLPVQFRFLAKKNLFHVPFLGWHLRRSGHVPVDREHPQSAMKSFEQAVRKIHDGNSMLLFPEGGRSRDGRLRPFKRGSFLLAVQAAAPVIPITLNGTRAVLPPNSLHIHPGRPEMIVHAPIETRGLAPKDIPQLSDKVRQQIEARYRSPEGTRSAS